MIKPRIYYTTTLLVLFLLLSSLVEPSVARPVDSREARCEYILRRLWYQQGGGEIPSIVIRPIDAYGKPAEYNSQLKQIIIDPQAYDLCVKMKPGQDDALAFLIAHELVHAIQHRTLGYSDPGFFVPTLTLKAWAVGKRDRRKQMESQADLWGAILCHLSGYDVVNTIEPFIEEVYQIFQLNEEDPLYDSKEERLAIAARAKKEAEQAIAIFDLANYMFVLQQHDLDTVLYHYLIDRFQSAEFYNNLGLSYLHMAIPKLEEPYRSYPYPFLLDTDTRLKRVVKGRNLSTEQLIRKSIANFNESTSLRGSYQAGHLNRAIAYHILSGVDEANHEKHLQMAQRALDFTRSSRVRYRGMETESSLIEEGATQLSSLLALEKANAGSLAWLSQPRTYAEIPSPNYLNWTLDGVDLSDETYFNLLDPKWETEIDYLRGISVYSRQLKASTLSVYNDPSAGKRFVLQRIDQKLSIPTRYQKVVFQVGQEIPKSVQEHLRRSQPDLQGCYFLIHDKLGIIYKMNPQNRVKEWAFFRSW